jgi:RNA polymerase sigma factor (sigma-70 family)
MHASESDPRPLLAETAWVHGLARSLLRDEHLAADIAQDALVVGLSRPAPDAAPDAVPGRGWLAGITRRLAAQAVRRRRERELRDLLAARPAAGDPEQRAAERLRVHELLTRAVRELPEPYRTAVTLRFFDGRSPRAIAKLRGQTPATARQHVHRGLAMLRSRLDREFGQRRGWLAAFAALGLGAPPLPWLPFATQAGLVRALVVALAVAAVAGTAWFARSGADHSPPPPSAPERGPAPTDDGAPSVDPAAAPTTPQGPAQPPDAKTVRDRVEAYWTKLWEIGVFRGTVLIWRGGELVFAREANSWVLVPNRFKLMSITKSVTAVAVLRLVQAGKLRLDDPVGKHLGDWPVDWRAVTVHDLLDHSSGIPNLENEWGNAQEQAKARGLLVWPAFAQTIAARPLLATPGKQIAYSNFNYELAGLVLEAVSGKPFRAVVRDEVLDPARMKDSYFDDGQPAKDLPVGLRLAADGRTEPTQQDMSRIQAAGGLVSTAFDLWAFDRTLRGDTLLDDAHKTLLFTPRQGNYACGFDTRPVFGHRCQQHSGGANGYVGDFLRFPDDDACVVVLSNYEFAPITRISNDLAAILFGIDRPMPKVVDGQELDGCVGCYTSQFEPARRLLVQRWGKVLLGFELWPNQERIGGRVLVPAGDGRFLSAMDTRDHLFTKDRVQTPYDELQRQPDATPAWRAAVGRYRLPPAFGTSAELVEDHGRLLLRIAGGWPAEVELAPVGGDLAIGLVMGNFGTLLHRDGAVLHWTRADGAKIDFTPVR